MLIVYVLRRYRIGKLRNLDLLISLALLGGLLTISINPDVVNAFLGFFSFEKQGGSRIIGLLIFSNFGLLLLFLYVLNRANSVDRNLSRLVSALARRSFVQDQRPADATDIIVLIPAYNEAENIGPLLARVPKEVLGLRVQPVVIVDGGDDKTAEIVRQVGVPMLVHPINRGGGAALRTGYAAVLEMGAPIIVTMDADGQHQPEEIERLVAPILRGEADLVNGSRVLGSYEREDLIRPAGVWLFNKLISLLTLTRITDASNAFRAMRRELLADVELEQDQFHTSELLIEALKKGYRVIEVPITIRARQAGTTKKPRSLRYGFGFARAIFETWLR